MPISVEIVEVIDVVAHNFDTEEEAVDWLRSSAGLSPDEIAWLLKEGRLRGTLRNRHTWFLVD